MPLSAIPELLYMHRSQKFLSEITCIKERPEINCLRKVSWPRVSE